MKRLIFLVVAFSLLAGSSFATLKEESVCFYCPPGSVLTLFERDRYYCIIPGTTQSVAVPLWAKPVWSRVTWTGCPSDYIPLGDGENCYKCPPTYTFTRALTDYRSSCYGACERIIGRWKWFTGYVVDFNPNGTWATTKDGHTGTWHCNWDCSVTVIPNAAKWRDTVTVSLDGLSLSGQNEQGVQVSATRHNAMLYDVEQGSYGGGRFCLTAEEATRIKNDPNTVKFTPVGLPCSK